MSKSLSWAATDAPRPFSVHLLYVAAAVLQAASLGLTRIAARTAARQAARVIHVHTVEFHAVYREADAPEGALYINGDLVGVIEGITRL